jgi:hypothetical protein
LLESSTPNNCPQDAVTCGTLVTWIHIPVCTCFTKKQAAPRENGKK